MTDEISKKLEVLAAQLQSQIWYPKNDREGYFFRSATTLILALLMLQIILFLPQEQAKTLVFIVFILAIGMASLLGNALAGLFLTIFATVAIIFRFYPTLEMTSFALIELIFFAGSGIIISYVIEKSKKMHLITEFQKKEQEYQQYIVKLTQDKTKAEKEIRVRDEFISIASHELKTPLTTTLLKLQTALHNVRNVSLANFSVQNLLDMLESAEMQTQRLAKMINDLLNVSLIRTGRLELELEDVDVNAVTKDIVERFAEKAKGENTKITFHPNGEATGKFDKLRIEQAITNLLSNALKYGHGKPIEVKVTKSDSRAMVSVRDNGIGISQENRERIFNLFERGVNSNDYKGLGVGLYLTRQIVKAHKGTIRVESQEGRGSEFIVELPLK